MFKNLLGSWYLKKKISNGFLGEGLVSLKSKKLNNFHYEEKSFIHKKSNENPMSADRVKWEHIQRVFELCERNVSETARRLNMHRRTLQRILSKRSPK